MHDGEDVAGCVLSVQDVMLHQHCTLCELWYCDIFIHTSNVHIVTGVHIIHQHELGLLDHDSGDVDTEYGECFPVLADLHDDESTDPQCRNTTVVDHYQQVYIHVRFVFTLSSLHCRWYHSYH
eukprot:PhF_6_TR26390/c0_g2_i1/m.38084